MFSGTPCTSAWLADTQPLHTFILLPSWAEVNKLNSHWIPMFIETHCINKVKTLETHYSLGLAVKVSPRHIQSFVKLWFGWILLWRHGNSIFTVSKAVTVSSQTEFYSPNIRLQHNEHTEALLKQMSVDCRYFRLCETILRIKLLSWVRTAHAAVGLV